MSQPLPALYGGVETGGTWCSCVIGRGPENVVAEERFSTADPNTTIEEIVRFFDEHEAPQAIGVGAFGPIDINPGSPSWGVMGRTPKPGWSGAGLGPALRNGTGLPIILDTDVNAAAIGEYRWGAGAGQGTLCYLTVGTGIGLGVVMDGMPVHGLLHPEAGHMRIPHELTRDPFVGSCPFHGDCWEGLASGQALLERWGVPGTELADDHPAWELETEYLAAGIVNVTFVLSPHRLIVGGGIALRPGLLDRVRDRVGELLADYLESDLLTSHLDEYIVGVGLNGRAGTLGALALASSYVL